MKKNTHPKYGPLKVQVGSDTFNLKSTYTGSELVMDIDYREHPAWQKKNATLLVDKHQNIKSFAKKFGKISLLGPTKSAE